MGGAVHLYQGEELVHFQARFLLSLVAQRVGHDGVGVGQVVAQRKGDGLAGRRGHCKLPLEGHKQSRLCLQKAMRVCARV